MIREYRAADTDTVLDIWLEASIKAHDFIAPEFWKSQVCNMRNIYLPASQTYVYLNGGQVRGFYSLHEGVLAAIFVSPTEQGCGIGKQLMTHAVAVPESVFECVQRESSKYWILPFPRL